MSQKFIFVWLVALAFALPVHSQVVSVTGGDSSLFGAAGASVTRYLPNSTDTFSGGIVNSHWLFGFNSLRLVHHWLFDAGDTIVPFPLFTDFSSYGTGIYLRGMTAKRVTSRGELVIALGQNEVNFNTPFMTTAKTSGDIPTALIFYTRHLIPKRLEISEHVVVSGRGSAITSLRFTPFKDTAVSYTRFSASAGIGSDSPYAGVLADARRGNWLAVKLAYVSSGKEFSRVLPALGVYSASENRGANGQIDFAPIPQHLHLTASHIGVLSQIVGLQAVLLGQSSVASTASSIGAFANAWHLTGSANIYEGSALGKKSTGSSLGAGVRFWKITEQSTYYKSNFGGAALGHIVQEVMSRHWSVSQFVTQQFAAPQQAARTSFDGGFSWTSNLLRAQLDWQEQYSPITAALGKGAFQRVMSLTVTVRLPHSSEITTSANTDPTGRVRFSAFGDSYFYGAQSFGGEQHGQSIGKFIYTGKVVDAKGVGVEGIAVKIGKDEAWTDSDGVFTLRSKSAKDLVLVVDLDSSTTPGAWRIVDCPATISANSTPARITLERK